MFNCWLNPESRNFKGGAGGNRNNNDDEESKGEMAEIVLLAAETPQAKEEKQYFWYDWCEEIEQEEAIEDTITVEGHDLNSETGSYGVNDDFFDNFDMTADMMSRERDTENMNFVSERAFICRECHDDVSSSNDDAFSDDEINSSESIPELIWHGGTDERNEEACDEDSVPELIEREESNWDSDSERSDDDSNPYETD